MQHLLRIGSVFLALMLVPFGTIKASLNSIGENHRATMLCDLEEDDTSVSMHKTTTANTNNICKFEKVTSTSGLNENDTYIIVSDANNVAMGKVSDNKGNPIDAYIDSDNGVCYLEGFEGYSLDKSSKYYYIMYEGNYLYGSKSGGSNLMQGSKPGNTSADVQAPYLWSITFDEKNVYVKLKNNEKNNNAILYKSTEYLSCFRNYSYAINEDIQTQLYKKLSSCSGVMLTVGTTGYATMYYSDRSFMMPNGLTGYTVTNFDVDNQTLTLEATYSSGSVIPAGEAVILKGDAKTYAFIDAETNVSKSSQNMLKGTDEIETVSATDGFLYFFGVDNGEVGFFLASEEGKSFENGAHKAYLELPSMPSSSSAKAITLDFKETTAIEEFSNMEADEDNQVYSLSGIKMRSDNLSKGIYIKNGRKFIVSK